MNIINALQANYQEFLVLLALAILVLPILGLLGVTISWKASLHFSPSALKAKVDSKHCLVTGASQGLGKASAIELVKAGAHTTIVSRSRVKLDKVLEELEVYRVNKEQIIQCMDVDLTSYSQTLEMAETLIKRGHHPDCLILCAGSAIPGFVADQLPSLITSNGSWTSIHESMMKSNYMTQVNVIQALIQCQSKQSTNNSSSIATTKPKNEVKDKISGISIVELKDKISGISKDVILPSQIILVGSILSILSMIGYTAYSSSKYATRGLADSLRSELKPLSINVSLFLPGNMLTPGFEEEGKTKPAITKEIEGTSAVVCASDAARDMFAGVLNKRYYVCNDFVGELARVSVNGGAPRPNLIFEVLATPLLAIVFSIWASVTDLQIKYHFKNQ